MIAVRQAAEGRTESHPIELQIGWLIERYGIDVLGPEPDFMQIVKATRAAQIYSAFERLGHKDGHKLLSKGEWRLVRDITLLEDEWHSKK